MRFHNGELFRIVVTYDRYKVEGMTASDVIQAISATYGIATRPVVQIPYHSIYGEVAQVIARWEDNEYSYNLVESGDQSSFSLILYSKQLQALAEAAISRYKRVIGDGLRSRTSRRQATEVAIAVRALNRMLEFGRPSYVRTA